MIIYMETFHCTTDTIAHPLKARDYKDPLIIVMDRAAYNQGENAKYDFEVRVGGGIATTCCERSGSGVL